MENCRRHNTHKPNQLLQFTPYQSSHSELRLNTSIAAAFNGQVLIGFTYNSGATTLVAILPNGYSGDLYTNALYGEQADVNRRARNLGNTLIYLKPVYDLHNTNDV